MPWHCNIHPDFPILELRFWGQLPPTELVDAFRGALIAASNENIIRVLTDCSELDGGHSNIDLYFLAETLEFEQISRA